MAFPPPPATERKALAGHIHQVPYISDTFQIDLETMPELRERVCYQIGNTLYNPDLILIPRLMRGTECLIVPRQGSLDEIPVILGYWPQETMAQIIDASEKGASLYGIKYHQGEFLELEV